MINRSLIVFTFALSQCNHCTSEISSNSFEGVLGIVRKYKGGPLFSCFSAFLWPNFKKSFRGFMRCPLPPCTHLCCTWIHWSRSLRGWGLSRPRFLSNGGLRLASPFEFWPTGERRRREGLVASEVAAKSNKKKQRWQTIENTHKVQCNYECLTRIILDCIC